MDNIESLLEQYKQNPAQDIFDLWQHEKDLRMEVRVSQGDYAALLLDTSEELALLYRAWYHGARKNDFLQVLCVNLNRLPIMKWLTASSPEMIQSLLGYLPWYITRIHPPVEKLQFLVHLYRQDLDHLFHPVLNILNLDQCRYLLDRTANADLRSQLKKRMQRIQDLRQDVYFGWHGRAAAGTQTCLFGDRISSLQNTVTLIWRTLMERGQEPYGLKPFLDMLECADLIFQCGLVEDSLAVLLDVYQDYLEKNRLVDLLEDEQIYKLMQKLLRRIVPMYAVLLSAPRSALKYDQIYKEHFPHFLPDPAAQAYLQLFDHLLSPAFMPTRGNWAVIKSLADRIHDNRPGEIVLLPGEWMTSQPLILLQTLAEQKKQSYPQEAFTICVLLRWLHQSGIATLDADLAVWLYTMYIDFWDWIPSRLFMNTDTWNVLAPLLNPTVRREGERRLEILMQLPAARIPLEIANRPDLFRKKNAAIQRHILSGRFLGVY